jgi:hypothetical protein
MVRWTLGQQEEAREGEGGQEAEVDEVDVSRKRSFRSLVTKGLW